MGEGGLQASLPRDKRKARISHHPALPYRGVAGFLADLATQEGTAARALHFAILTAARTNEVIGATWSEIDLEERLWTIPKDRMKAGKEHRVALSSAAVDNAEAAYQRGDLLQKRRALMEDWATYCAMPRPAKADVTPIRAKSSA